MPIRVGFVEDGLHTLECQTLMEQAGVERAVKISWHQVAEVKIISLNLYDYYPAADLTMDEDSGFFLVENGVIEKLTVFDPLNRLNLKCYLLNGYDTHLCVTASGFEILDCE